MATLNISIPHSMKEWIDAQVESGGYANASDYIRDS
jgi:antitoxin ParD1/3/4